LAHGAAAAAAAVAAGALPPRASAPGCNGHLGGAGGLGGGFSAPAYLPTPAGCPPTSAGVQNSPYARYVCAGGAATSAPFLPGGGPAIGSGIVSLPTSGPPELAAQAASVSAAE